MIFKEVNGFEADLILSDGKWVGKVTSVGSFWSVPWRNAEGRLRVGLEIKFVRNLSAWVLKDSGARRDSSGRIVDGSTLPWFILYPGRG